MSPLMGLRWMTFLAVLLFVYTGSVLSQQRTGVATVTVSPRLFDSLMHSNGESRSASFDGFFVEIANQPNSIGYVFVFCGKNCRFGEVESHLRGIELKIATKRFDRHRLVLLNGGFRETATTELWLVPDGVCPPIPNSTVKLSQVKFVGMRKYNIEPYDCCDDLDQLWRELRP